MFQFLNQYVVDYLLYFWWCGSGAKRNEFYFTEILSISMSCFLFHGVVCRIFVDPVKTVQYLSILSPVEIKLFS